MSTIGAIHKSACYHCRHLGENLVCSLPEDVWLENLEISQAGGDVRCGLYGYVESGVKVVSKIGDDS